ncbi:MAG: hypothetical protein SO415_05515 [Oliverpabstia sp.]|nr:hypothetical protein [Oliverpabstia sp.]MDY5617476.1 hypothetical protein [Lachnospiraceae bacterium]
MAKLNLRSERRIIRISPKELYWFVLLILPMKTVYMTKIEVIDTLFFWGELAFDIIVLFILFLREKYKINYSVIFFICYQVIVLGSTVYNGGEILAQGEHALTFSCLILFIDYIIQTDTKKAISSFLMLFEFLVYLNFILLLVYPEGIYLLGGRGVWLFGQANDSTLYFTCALMIAFLYSYYVKKKDDFLTFRSLILTVICVISTILTDSSTSTVGIILMMAVILAYSIFKISISPNYGLLAGIGIFVGFIILRLQEYFQSFIVNILHRSITFSNRTRIWDSAFYYIAQKPMLGYGMESRIDAGNRFLGNSTPHNKILYTTYLGGILLLFIFIIIIIYTIKKLNQYSKSAAKAFITGPIIALLIQMQFESYTLFPFWIPFLFGMYIEQIVSLRDT